MNASSLFNGGREVTIKGKTYAVKDLTLDKLFKLAQWLQDRAFAAIDRQTGLDEPAKAQMRVALVGQIAAGAYDPGGEVFNHSCLQVEGAAHGLYLALEDDDPDLDEADVVKWMREGVEEAARAAVGALGDPKASPQGASHPGGKSSRTSGTTTGGRSKKSKRSRRPK